MPQGIQTRHVLLDRTQSLRQPLHYRAHQLSTSLTCQRYEEATRKPGGSQRASEEESEELQRGRVQDVACSMIIFIYYRRVPFILISDIIIHHYRIDMLTFTRIDSDRYFLVHMDYSSCIWILHLAITHFFDVPSFYSLVNHWGSVKV